MEVRFTINERIVKTIKTIFTGKPLAVTISSIIILTSAITYSAVTIPHIFAAGDIISAAEMNENFEALRSKIAELEANVAGAPVGTVIAFAGNSDKLPAGWLLCDGKEYNRIGTYANLFTAISDNWGPGDGVNTFNVPDLRGVTLRGSNKTGTETRTGDYADPDFALRVFYKNDGAQRSDNDELIGSFQMDAFQGHKHNVTAMILTGFSGGGTGYNTGADTVLTGSTPISDGINGDPRAKSETRAKNAAVHYIIKY